MICIEEGDKIRFEPIRSDEEYDMISEILDILYFDEES